MDLNPCACLYPECIKEGRCLAMEKAREAYSPNRIDLEKLAKLFEFAPSSVEICGDPKKSN